MVIISFTSLSLNLIIHTLKIIEHFKFLLVVLLISHLKRLQLSITISCKSWKWLIFIKHSLSTDSIVSTSHTPSHLKHSISQRVGAIVSLIPQPGKLRLRKHVLFSQSAPTSKYQSSTMNLKILLQSLLSLPQIKSKFIRYLLHIFWIPRTNSLGDFHFKNGIFQWWKDNHNMQQLVWKSQ